MEEVALPDGLAVVEACRRLAKNGPNTVPDELPSGWRRALQSSWPSRWVALSSIADVMIITVPAIRGWLMSPLPLLLIGIVLTGAVVLAFVLDLVKATAFVRLKLG